MRLLIIRRNIIEALDNTSWWLENLLHWRGLIWIVQFLGLDRKLQIRELLGRLLRILLSILLGNKVTSIIFTSWSAAMSPISSKKLRVLCETRSNLWWTCRLCHQMQRCLLHHRLMHGLLRCVERSLRVMHWIKVAILAQYSIERALWSRILTTTWYLGSRLGHSLRARLGIRCLRSPYNWNWFDYLSGHLLLGGNNVIILGLLELFLIDWRLSGRSRWRWRHNDCLWVKAHWILLKIQLITHLMDLGNSVLLSNLRIHSIGLWLLGVNRVSIINLLIL